MREDLLTSILTELNDTSTDIEASGVMSVDGLMMAAALPTELDEDRVGAMSAAMLSLGNHTTQELQRGELEQVLIRGNRGSVLMIYAGSEAILTIMIKSQTKQELVFPDIKRSAEKIKDLL